MFDVVITNVSTGYQKLITVDKVPGESLPETLNHARILALIEATKLFKPGHVDTNVIRILQGPYLLYEFTPAYPKGRIVKLIDKGNKESYVVSIQRWDGRLVRHGVYKDKTKALAAVQRLETKGYKAKLFLDGKVVKL